MEPETNLAKKRFVHRTTAIVKCSLKLRLQEIGNSLLNVGGLLMRRTASFRYGGVE